MKKHVYLITTVATALLAGTVIGAAQGTQGQTPSAGQSTPSQGQIPDKQPRKEQSGQPQTQGQAQGQQQQPGQAPAQPPQREQTQKGQDKQGAQQKSGGSGSSATFTTEQRTHIRTTVLRGSNAPRATNVNFSINVGTAVPTSVRVATVPQVIVDVHPEWRGLKYFIVNDQIIIVDRNNKIVAVLNV